MSYLITKAGGWPRRWTFLAFLISLALFIPEITFPYNYAFKDGKITTLRPWNHLEFIYEYDVKGKIYSSSAYGTQFFHDYGNARVGEPVTVFYNKSFPFISSLNAPLVAPIGEIIYSIEIAIGFSIVVIIHKILVIEKRQTG